MAVRNTRKIGKRDLKWNDALPKITVDPETYDYMIQLVRRYGAYPLRLDP